MSAIGASPTPRPSAAPRAVGHAAPRATPSPDDVSAMRGAFAKAETGRMPLLQERGGKGDAKLRALKLKADGLAGDEAKRQADAGTIHGRERDHGRLDADRDSDKDGQQGLFATAQPAVTPIAVPDMPGPHVDPAAFAQLMTQLWLREKGKGSKDVRVSFGQDAWPATGARLVRNAGGTLDIQLHVADGGAAYDGATLDTLHNDLAANGLAIGSLALETGALA